MTDIDATRKTPLAAEPGNNAFVVWYDPNREPYAVYFRSDANAWDDDQRWFNGDQVGGDLDGPFSWDNLREEMRGNDGPHLLVPGAKVDELTAALAEAREQVDSFSTLLGDANDRLTESRAQAATYANEIGSLKADLERMRLQVYAQKPVIEAAHAWSEMRETDDVTPTEARKLASALHHTVEQLRVWDLALMSVSEEPAEATR